MNRKPNEVWISPEVLQGILVSGEAFTDVVVERGPSPQANIVDVVLEWRFGVPTVIVTYDRPVDEPVLKVVHR